MNCLLIPKLLLKLSYFKFKQNNQTGSDNNKETEETDIGFDFNYEGEDDDIYTQAVNIVRTERKTSISYIQRCLRIGYNRAANIVETMEKNGILSPPNHSGKREVLLPED